MKHIHLCCLVILLAVAGCGKGFVPFSGKVTFEEDGSPLTKGTVVFATATFQAEGGLGPDGTYHLGSLKSKDGLPPGNYKVFVTGAGTVNDKEKFVSDIDPTFADRTTTTLTCDVPASGKDSFDFKVKKPAAK